MKTSEILIEGMEFYAYHGFYEEENRIGCRYSIDMRLTLNLDQPCTNDDLNDTINYEEVYKIVQEEMKLVSKLIEHVAQRIITRIKKRYTKLEQVELTLYKYNPPLGGQVTRVGIHLTA